MLKPVADGKYAHYNSAGESCPGFIRNGRCDICNGGGFMFDSVIVSDYNGRKLLPSAEQRRAGCILPWTEITAAYTLVFDIGQFVKRKRTVQSCILAENYFPRRCSACNKEISKTDPNRAEITPKGRLWVAHYDCAWSALLYHIYGPLYDSVMGR